MRRLDPSEFFAVTIPVLAEFVAVSFAVGVAILGVAIFCDPSPVPCRGSPVEVLFTDCEVQ